MNSRRSILMSCLLVACVSSVQAQTINPLLSQTIGSGSNESYFVVDFEDGTSDPSYAFGYRYNGSPTSADLLAALAAQTSPPLMVDYAPGYGPGESSFGVAVGGFSYNGHTEAGFGANGYWNFWGSPDGVNWTSASVGPSDNTLVNGSWDGWSWEANGAFVAPTTPLAVPDPSGLTIMAQGVGLLALARYRKRRASKPAGTCPTDPGWL